MTDHLDAIAAFVDNEPVGAEDLAAALSEPSGRAYLIDLLVLRGLVGDAQAHVGLPPSRNASADRRSLGEGGQPAAGSSRRSLWIAAAAAMVTVGLAGFLAGRTLSDRLRPAEPPVAAGVVEPGTAAGAPAPTHVIRMEKGVDWNERSGGN